jgi:predicted ATPase
MTSSALRSAQDQAEIEAAARGSVETDEEQQRDRLRQQQDQEALFRRNLKDVFVLQYFSLQGVRFFDDFQYQLQPRINVLLGKNGYGKTILLRNIAAMIQNDLKYSSQLFDLRKADAEPQLILEVTRNSKTARTVRNIFSFREKLGKIPLLAIPDSRFLNRSQTIVQASATGHILLAESGARHFLSQEPYEDVVEQFLSQLGIEYYMERRKGFRQPIFELIESAVRELTDDQEFAFCKIERIGQTGFEIWVRTTTSPGEPLPIHYASQGTLSVIAIIGLIYSFLRSLDPEGPEDLVMGKPGIVIIDEIDAHLHPAWQRKIIGLLCDRFPNVQFLVSAHSPVIVAECEWGEISVLRRNNISHCFYIETLERDFIGATYRELYDLIFEIDDIDEKYIHDAIKLATVTEEEREHEISLLDKKGQLSVDEERRINRLERETLLIRRAAEVRRHKMEDEQSRIEELEAEIRRLRDLQGKNPRSDPNG